MTTQEATILAAVIAVFSAFGVAALARLLKISEFRQAWIIDLRKDVADYLGTTQRWFNRYVAGDEQWKLDAIGNEATVLFYRIKMRINPLPNRHKRQDDEFLAAMATLRMPYTLPKEDAIAYWFTNAERGSEQARLLFKREWEATKRLGISWWRGKRSR